MTVLNCGNITQAMLISSPYKNIVALISLSREDIYLCYASIFDIIGSIINSSSTIVHSSSTIAKLIINDTILGRTVIYVLNREGTKEEQKRIQNLVKRLRRNFF